MVNLVSVLLGFLYLFFLQILIKYIRKLWWNPVMLQKMMKRQGISGPSYKFMYGNSKDIADMRKNSVSRPLQAHSHQVFSRTQPEVYSWVAKYELPLTVYAKMDFLNYVTGSNYLFWRGPKAELGVTEPELIKEILINKDGVYGKGDPLPFVKRLLGDGVLMADGAKWAKLRKLSNHAFHGESLKGMFPAMVEGAEMMLRRWSDNHSQGREVDVYKEFRQLTAEVISRTAFGSSYMDGEKIFKHLMKLVALTGRNLFNVQIPLLSKLRKNRDEMEADYINKELKEILVGMIKTREETEMNREAPSSFGDDFLASLVRAKNSVDPNRRMTLEEMVDECKTFYFAGQETTNSSLSWTVYLLALHQNWQDEVRKEVDKVFGHNAPDPEGLAKLKTMGMVINESLRLYPPVAGAKRQVQKKVRLGNLLLPAGMNLFISTVLCHYNPDIWGQDVHLFKPERFAEGIAKATGNNVTAFMPFGLGQRNCVGSSFATAEVKITLSMILQRFRFSLSPAYVHSPILQLTLRPQHGVQVILHPL